MRPANPSNSKLIWSDLNLNKLCMGQGQAEMGGILECPNIFVVALSHNISAMDSITASSHRLSRKLYNCKEV